jgi:HEAT repeat protein
VLPILEAGVREHDWFAAGYLGEMGSAAAPAIPVLEEVLENSAQTAITNQLLASALAQFGNVANPAACSAVQSLAKISPSTVPILVAALQDSDPSVRVNACSALASLGRRAEAAVPALKALVGDPFLGCRMVLWKGGPQFIPYSAERTTVAAEAAAALKRIEPEGRSEGP